MYTVYVDELLVHDQASPSDAIHLVEPSLKLADNSAGSFEFIIPPDHIGYDSIDLLSDTISVQREGQTIWSGRPISQNEDFWKRRKYTCEGALAYLNDSIQPDEEYGSTEGSVFFQKLIEIHNEKVGKNRQFEIGILSFEDMNDPCTYKTQFENTWESIKTNFVDRLSGHVYITYNGGGNTPCINYRQSYFERNPQEVNFGKNLLDFAQNWDMTNVCTAIFPRGKQVEG